MTHALSFNFDVDTEANGKAIAELNRLRELYPKIVEAFVAEIDASEMFSLQIDDQHAGSYDYIAAPTPQFQQFIKALRCLETKGFRNPAGAEYP